MRLHLYKRKSSLIIIDHRPLAKKAKLKNRLKKLIEPLFKSKEESIYDSFFNLKVGQSKDILFTPKNSKKINLGYLIYKGFKITKVDPVFEDEKLITLKRVLPYLREDKKYSILIKLPRTGKGGKRIYVYKFRTMQPYAEYLQSSLIKINGFNKDGTIKEDFRITKLGKFLRKYWIDELPMLINLLKGDLKLMGVRPLSDAMLSEYPSDFIPFRNKFKPGLIPPYYIDNPQSFEEIIDSEYKYLKLYRKNPIKTDIIYFIKFLDRIFFKGVRSK